MARIILPLVVFIMAFSYPASARAGFEAGVSIGEEGIESFYLSAGGKGFVSINYEAKKAKKGKKKGAWGAEGAGGPPKNKGKWK